MGLGFFFQIFFKSAGLAYIPIVGGKFLKSSGNAFKVMNCALPELSSRE